MDDDDMLIARLAAGDDTALRELFARHAPWLAARLRAVLPISDVEDVLQETFIAVWRGAGSYRPESAAGGWLWGIARRQAALLLRRRGPALAVLLEHAGPGDAAAGDASDAVAVRTDLERAVAALGATERTAWRLVCEQDRPVTEVADLMGVPPGTVKSRVHRARRMLRATLGGAR